MNRKATQFKTIVHHTTGLNEWSALPMTDLLIEEALDCPNCNSGDDLYIHTSVAELRAVKCEMCGMSGPLSMTIQGAVDSWNNVLLRTP